MRQCMAAFDARVPLIQPNDIRKAPTSDAWGHAFTYVPGSDGQSYRLVSFEDDAILDSGSITRPWPFK